MWKDSFHHKAKTLFINFSLQKWRFYSFRKQIQSRVMFNFPPSVERIKHTCVGLVSMAFSVTHKDVFSCSVCRRDLELLHCDKNISHLSAPFRVSHSRRNFSFGQSTHTRANQQRSYRQRDTQKSNSRIVVIQSAACDSPCVYLVHRRWIWSQSVPEQALG